MNKIGFHFMYSIGDTMLPIILVINLASDQYCTFSDSAMKSISEFHLIWSQKNDCLHVVHRVHTEIADVQYNMHSVDIENADVHCTVGDMAQGVRAVV